MILYQTHFTSKTRVQQVTYDESNAIKCNDKKNETKKTQGHIKKTTGSIIKG